MIGRHWVVQVIIFAGIYYLDYTVGTPFIGFFMAIMYFLGSLVSLIKRDKYMAGKRFAYMLLFFGEMVAAKALTEHPANTDLVPDFVNNILDDLWPKK